MAYFAVYCIETGVILNVVECPEFLKQRIHLDPGQDVLQIDQIEQQRYLVKNQQLVENQYYLN